MCHCTLQGLLHYLYTDKLDGVLKAEELSEMLNCAVELKLESLEHQCRTKLITSLDLPHKEEQYEQGFAVMTQVTELVSVPCIDLGDKCLSIH